MFQDYYEQELVYLRELGAEFARRYPRLAPHLGSAAADPDVERLLEGFAFLTARVREQLDQGNAHVAEQLAEIFAPHLLRPVPASAIVQFHPVPGQLRSRYRLGRGLELGTRPVNGVHGRFRTCMDVELVPASITAVRMDDSRTYERTLHVGLEVDPAGLEAVLDPAGLRLYIAEASTAASATLLRWLLQCCTGVRLGEAGRIEAGIKLPGSVVQHAGLDARDGLVPSDPTTPDGYRLLQELFVLPQRFLFVTVTGLEAAIGRVIGPSLELVFDLTLDAEERLSAKLSPRAMRLHCAPVVNLFSSSATVRAEQAESAALLQPDDRRSKGYTEVFSVDEVTSRDLKGNVVAAAPRARMGDGAGLGGSYRVTRSVSPLDGHLDTYITVLRPRLSPLAGRDAISVSLTCTNRGLPEHQDEAGVISVPLPGSSGLATFENITRISPPVTPQLGTEVQWQLLGLLSASQTSLASVEALRRILLILTSSGGTDSAKRWASEQRTEGIEAVDRSISNRMVQGALLRGARTTVAIRESSFDSVGEVFLFGMVLNEVFAERVALNAFHELRIELRPSGRVLAWAPRCGKHVLV